MFFRCRRPVKYYNVTTDLLLKRRPPALRVPGVIIPLPLPPGETVAAQPHSARLLIT